LAPEYNSWEPGTHLKNIDPIVNFIEKYKPALPVSPSITHSGVQPSFHEIVSGSPPKFANRGPFKQSNFVHENIDKIDPQLFVPGPCKPLDIIGKFNQEQSINSFPESAYLCAKSDASDLDFLDQNRSGMKIYTVPSRHDFTDDSKVIEERGSSEVKESMKTVVEVRASSGAKQNIKNVIEAKDNKKDVVEDKARDEAKGNTKDQRNSQESSLITSSSLCRSSIILPPLPTIDESESPSMVKPPTSTLQLQKRLSRKALSFRKFAINRTPDSKVDRDLSRTQDSKVDRDSNRIPSKKMLIRRAFSSRTFNT